MLLQAKLYKCLPSEIVGIDKEDTYTAYCFNEACAYIIAKIDSGEKPKYTEKKKYKVKEYTSFTDFYDQFNK